MEAVFDAHASVGVRLQRHFVVLAVGDRRRIRQPVGLRWGIPSQTHTLVRKFDGVPSSSAHITTNRLAGYAWGSYRSLASSGVGIARSRFLIARNAEVVDFTISSWFSDFHRSRWPKKDHRHQLTESTAEPLIHSRRLSIITSNHLIRPGRIRLNRRRLPSLRPNLTSLLAPPLASIRKISNARIATNKWSLIRLTSTAPWLGSFALLWPSPACSF